MLDIIHLEKELDEIKSKDFWKLYIESINKEREIAVNHCIQDKSREDVRFFQGKVQVIDDILSGGATAIGIAEKLKYVYANKLYLIISHVESEYGLKRVLEHYDHVYVTNSMGELPHIDGVSVYDLFEDKN